MYSPFTATVRTKPGLMVQAYNGKMDPPYHGAQEDCKSKTSLGIKTEQSNDISWVADHSNTSFSSLMV